MNSFPRFPVLLFTLSASIVSGADFQALVDNSPFGTPPKKEETAAAEDEPTPLEFRSVVQEGSIRLFSVYDPSAQRGYWIRQGDKSGPIVIDNFDPQTNVLTLAQGGRSLNLTLKKAEIVASAAPAPAASAQAGLAPPAGNGQRIRAPRDPVADARRLEAVAAEVRRRRALRQAAATGTAAPAP